jgi:hypothetical protein
MGTKVTVDDIANVENSSGVPTINENFDAVADEFDLVHYSDGSQAATGDWDMDSNRILNLPAPISSGEPARLADLAVTVTDEVALAILNSKVDQADLASTATGKGAALVGYKHGGTAEGALDRLLGAGNYPRATLNAREYGVVAHTTFTGGTGTMSGTITGQAATIQAAIDWLKTNVGHGVIVFDHAAGNIPLEASLYWPAGIVPYFINIRRQWDNPATGLAWASMSTGEYYDKTGTLVSGASAGTGVLHWMNIDPSDDATTWVDTYPGQGSGVVTNAYIDGSATSGIHGFKFAGSYEFDHLRGSKVGSMICTVNEYSDGVKIFDVECNDRASLNDYLVDLGTGLGDNLTIDGVATGWVGGNETAATAGKGVNALFRSGTVRNLLNGHHVFTANNLEIACCHIETGSITLNRHTGLVHSNDFHQTNGGEGQLYIKNDTTGSLGQTLPMVLNNVWWVYAGWSSESLDVTDRANIVFSDNGAAILQGNTRQYVQSGNLGARQTGAIKISEQIAGLNGLYNRFAAYLTHKPVLVNVGGTVLDHTIPATSANFTGLGAPSEVASAINFGAAAGATTYYYSADLIIDATRLLGRTMSNSEASITLSTTTLKMIKIPLSWGVTQAGCRTVRVYRGTSTGSYRFYVDVPAVVMSYLYDDGLTLNGYPWVDRGSSSGKTALNNNATSGAVRLSGTTLEIGTSVGVSSMVGTWVAGDKLNSDVVTAATGTRNMQWVRQTSGTGWVNGTDYRTITVTVA